MPSPSWVRLLGCVALVSAAWLGGPDEAVASAGAADATAGSAAPSPEAAAPAEASGRAEPRGGWLGAAPAARRELERGFPLLVHVIVPLCDEAYVACGPHGLGAPRSPRTNLYWGARFGIRRYLDRSTALTRVSVEASDGPVLERARYRRTVPGERFGVSRPEVELWVVVDAVEGGAMGAALQQFFDEATGARGLDVAPLDASAEGPTLPVHATVFAGHNGMYDGHRPVVHAGAEPAAAFALSCFSRSWFEARLRAGGARLLVGADALVAPEGYAVEALLDALAEGDSAAGVTARVRERYGAVHGLSSGAAARLFSSDDADGPLARWSR